MSVLRLAMYEDPKSQGADHGGDSSVGPGQTVPGKQGARHGSHARHRRVRRRDRNQHRSFGREQLNALVGLGWRVTIANSGYCALA
jgi:hypothetical protein